MAADYTPTFLMVISPTLDQEFVSTYYTLVDQTFSNVIEHSCWEGGTTAIEQLNELVYNQQFSQRKERVIVITDFILSDMHCYEFLARVKQIRSPPGYIHVAVVDPKFRLPRKTGCKQRGAQYYREPMSTIEMGLFQSEIIRKEAEIQEELRIQSQAQRQDALRIQEPQRQQAPRNEVAQRQLGLPMKRKRSKY